jgi:ribosome recycling factor
MSELQKWEDQMKKVIERIHSEFASIRTGRAHASILDNIRVDYYGTPTAVSQMASVSVADARTLEIKPWDAEGLKGIETAILKSDLGLNPLNDGKVIRLTMPTPTTERRQELVKVIRKQTEEFRVAVRNIRRDGVEELKKAEKDKKISQDDLRRSEQSLQKLTDQYIKNIDGILASKEKDILEV